MMHHFVNKVYSYWRSENHTTSDPKTMSEPTKGEIFSEVEAKFSSEFTSFLATDELLVSVLKDLETKCTVKVTPPKDSDGCYTLTGTAAGIKDAEKYCKVWVAKKSSSLTKRGSSSSALKSLSLPDLTSGDFREAGHTSIKKVASHEDLVGAVGPDEHDLSHSVSKGKDDLFVPVTGYGVFTGTDFPKEDAYYLKQTKMPSYIWIFIKQKCWLHIQSILNSFEALLVSETHGDTVTVIIKCIQKEKLDSAADAVYTIISTNAIGKTTLNLAADKTVKDSEIQEAVFTISKQIHEVVIIFENKKVDVIGTKENVNRAMATLVKLLEKPPEKISTKWLFTPSTTLYTYTPANGPVVYVYKSDICTLPVQIVVCPTNSILATSAGVAGAIHKTGGRKFRDYVADYLKKHGRLGSAEVAVTPSGDLKCDNVYHVNGPKPRSEEDTGSAATSLSQAFYNCLHNAHVNKAISIAIPAISCGNNGLPHDMVAKAMVQEVIDFISKRSTETSLKQIHLVDINDTILDSISRKLQEGVVRLPIKTPMASKPKSALTASRTLKDEGYTSYVPSPRYEHHKTRHEARMPRGWASSLSPPKISSGHNDRTLMTFDPRMTLPGSDASPEVPVPPVITGITDKTPSSSPGPFSLPRLPTPVLDHTKVEIVTTKKKTASKRSSKKKLLKSESSSSPELQETCCICLCEPTDPKTLDKCKHKFCTDCIDQYFKTCNPKCPVCGTIYGVMKGNQPKDGTMSYIVDNETHLPGYEKYGTIVIHYTFPPGTQTEEHPDPGKPYSSTYRRAYLPNNSRGKKLVKLLEEAFHARMMFTIGHSVTTGREGVVTWNDIHHKTNIHGGPTRYGYPDPTYLDRLEDELAARGLKSKSSV